VTDILGAVKRERVRRRPREHTRAELLDAAARVFAERGFRGASVEAVAEAAGFSTGAVYSNFKGKDDLFLALYEERIERRRRELREAVEEAGGRAPGLRAGAASAAAALAQDRDWFLLYFEFVLHAARDARFRRRFRALRREGLAELTDGLAEGLAHAGVDSPLEAEELARAVRALSHGLALEEVLEPDARSGELLARVLGVLFAGLRAGTEP
jgi:AcrR family transcriptional regulator